MSITHHPLVEEFPEYKDQLHALKLSDAHFRRLTHEYEGIDKSIVRAEQGMVSANDDYMTELKKDRLHLKDQIFEMLTKP